MEPFQIFCYLDGQGDSFPIDIKEDMNMRALQVAIRRRSPQTFSDIEASNLVLYQVDIEPENLMAKLGDIPRSTRGFTRPTCYRSIIKRSPTHTKFTSSLRFLLVSLEIHDPMVVMSLRLCYHCHSHPYPPFLATPTIAHLPQQVPKGESC